MERIEEEKPRDRILSTETVRDMLNMGKTRFSQMINDPEKRFPRPVEGFSRVRHGFLESEILTWLRSRPRIDPPKPQKPFTGLADAKRKGSRQALAEARQKATGGEGQAA